MSGNEELAYVFSGWVRRDLEHISSLKRDDHVHFVVQDGLGPYRFRAIQVIHDRGEGTDNQGLSTGSRRIPEKGKPEKKKQN